MTSTERVGQVKRVEQLRAQGERTRIHLAEVARQQLDKDPAVSLTAVAKAAGVGIGPLYRHFPTREALVLELYRNEAPSPPPSPD